ncbi:hypothetical protein D8674_027680 [Pyrus ussuriensis x Pyrus communis]|uniref:Ethylene-responsive nuclear family protein n=1 Tax=Pyrus ussuriensis x Pyrus communis TaxID=2448454 RepID=A0A5N5IAD1_9ROSA|nr:hypothetical protein D8674_027680 [Pyrus ussuriensis x Pyrus communis]
MPLPWKKTRANRISQFVADLQSPKRGGSLVVQTGFPTSLIDLFFKNRDHLKKPSKKHKNKSKKRESRVEDRVDDRITLNCELGSGDLPILVKPNSPKVENLKPREADHGDEATAVENRKKNCVVGGEDCIGGNWGPVLTAVMKMFVVVVLALSTKKLVVGVTLSAFLLLLLEYTGKHLALFLKPCSNAKSVMGQRLSAFLLFLNGFESDDLKGVIARERTVFLDSAIEEIEIVDANKKGRLIELLHMDCENEKAAEKGSVCVDKTSGEKSMVELLGMECKKKRVVDKRRVCVDKTVEDVSLVKLLGKDYKKVKLVEGGEDGGEFVGDKKSKGSKNAKIKAKLIKKFVPKKLRRKGKPNEQELKPVLYGGDSSFLGVDKVEGCEAQEDHEGVKEEEHESENISVFSLDAEEKSEIQGLDRVSDHGEGSLAGGESTLVVDKKGREGKEGNFGYLFLFLIVLAGLFGGRLVALLLTVTFCFLSKLIGRLVKLCP